MNFAGGPPARGEEKVDDGRHNRRVRAQSGVGVTAMAMLSLSAVSKSFGSLKVTDDVSFEVP